MSSLVFFIFSTALLENCCFGVVASRDKRCFTFMYDNSSCPESWHLWDNSCYMTTESSFTWFKAIDECRNLGGILAAPSSTQENDLIVSLIPKGGYVWIDCTDQDVEGTWECREGNVEVTYRNWYPNEPNNEGDEDCAIISRAVGLTEWHDVGCNWVCRVVCKMAGRPVLQV